MGLLVSGALLGYDDFASADASPLPSPAPPSLVGPGFLANSERLCPVPHPVDKWALVECNMNFVVICTWPLMGTMEFLRRWRLSTIRWSASFARTALGASIMWMQLAAWFRAMHCTSARDSRAGSTHTVCGRGLVQWAQPRHCLLGVCRLYFKFGRTWPCVIGSGARSVGHSLAGGVHAHFQHCRVFREVRRVLCPHVLSRRQSTA